MFTSFAYQSPSIVTRNLVLHYDAADRTTAKTNSTTVFDLTENNYTGSLINGASFVTESRGLFRYDGANDGLRRVFQTGDKYNVSQSLELTLDIWWKWNTTVRSLDGGIAFGEFFGNNAAGDFQWQLAKHISGTPSQVYFFFQIANTTQIRTLTWQSGSGGGGFDVTTVTNNTWYNFCYTGKSPDIKGYIDGTDRGGGLTGTYPTTLALPQASKRSLNIGGTRPVDSLYSFLGDIAVVRIYDRALLPEEVLQNYNATRHRFGK